MLKTPGLQFWLGQAQAWILLSISAGDVWARASFWRTSGGGAGLGPWESKLGPDKKITNMLSIIHMLSYVCTTYIIWNNSDLGSSLAIWIPVWACPRSNLGPASCQRPKFCQDPAGPTSLLLDLGISGPRYRIQLQKKTKKHVIDLFGTLGRN